MSLLWLLSWWLSNSTVPPPPDWTEALLDLKALWFFCLHYCSRFVKWSNKRIMPGLVGGDGVWKRWSHTQSQRFGSESWFFYDLFSWLTSQFVRKNNSIVTQRQNNNIHDDDVLINKEGIAAFPRESQWSESNVSVRLQPCVDLTCLPPISGSQRPLLDEIQTSTFLKNTVLQIYSPVFMFLCSNTPDTMISSLSGELNMEIN